MVAVEPYYFSTYLNHVVEAMSHTAKPICTHNSTGLHYVRALISDINKLLVKQAKIVNRR